MGMSEQGPAAPLSLPPHQVMTTGVMVVGKTVEDAQLSMSHDKAALISATLDGTLDQFFRFENTALCAERLAPGHEFISRYEANREPMDFWGRILDGDLSFK